MRYSAISLITKRQEEEIESILKDQRQIMRTKTYTEKGPALSVMLCEARVWKRDAPKFVRIRLTRPDWRSWDVAF